MLLLLSVMLLLYRLQCSSSPCQYSAAAHTATATAAACVPPLLLLPLTRVAEVNLLQLSLCVAHKAHHVAQVVLRPGGLKHIG
jgi:hypothetical protein